MDNMYDSIGYQQPQHFRRYSKSEVIQAIQMHCYQQTGVSVSNVVRLEETPSTLRHSCMETGIAHLPTYNWQVPTEYGSVNVPFYFCDKCGKLYVYSHIYD